MQKIISSLIILILFIGCRPPHRISEMKLNGATDFPRWLSSNGYSTDQTSGIVYIGLDNKKNKIFLLADDTGKLHHLKFVNDTGIVLKPVYFNKTVEEFLAKFPKKDFEEITLDKQNGNVYLSIEGNGKDFKKYAGIYKITFKDGSLFSDSLTGIEKLNFFPESLFQKYLENNIGYEGLTVDSKYFYLGLEGFVNKGVFADSTFIFIADKNSHKIIKTISTKPFGIATVCGLYSDSEGSLYGIDRNDRKLFHIQLDENLELMSIDTANINSSIPFYPSFSYVASLESVTKDESGNIYLVDDPWKNYFIPSNEILKKLDPATVQNFKNFIPVIYKFKEKIN